MAAVNKLAVKQEIQESPVVVDSWEDTEQLERQMQLLTPPSRQGGEVPKDAQGDVPASSANAAQDPDTRKILNTGSPAPTEPPMIDQLADPFFHDALTNHRNRLTVLKIEMELEKFLKAPLEQLQFASSMTSFQRLSIHRVAAFYGLQSAVLSTEDGSPGQGYVVVRKTPRTTMPAVKLADYKTLEQVRTEQAPKVKGIKQRPARKNGADGFGSNGAGGADAASSVKTVEERKEDYNRAREQIFNPQGEGSGGSGSKPRRENSGQRSAQRVAIMRDREKDLQDPDFHRRSSSPQGFSQPYSQQGYSQGPQFAAQSRYQVPTYVSEFPSLHGASSGMDPSQPAAPSPTMHPYSNLGNDHRYQSHFQVNACGPAMPPPMPPPMPQMLGGMPSPQLPSDFHSMVGMHGWGVGPEHYMHAHGDMMRGAGAHPQWMMMPPPLMGHGAPLPPPLPSASASGMPVHNPPLPDGLPPAHGNLQQHHPYGNAPPMVNMHWPAPPGSTVFFHQPPPPPSGPPPAASAAPSSSPPPSFAQASPTEPRQL